MKLYKVTVEFDMYVIAEDKDDAESIAEGYAAEELSNTGGNCWAREVNCKSDNPGIEEEWKASYPYANRNCQLKNKTINEIVDILKHE